MIDTQERGKWSDEVRLAFAIRCCILSYFSNLQLRDTDVRTLILDTLCLIYLEGDTKGSSMGSQRNARFSIIIRLEIGQFS